MDDLAPAPLQRISDEGGRKPEDLYPARGKAPKKAPPVPRKEPSSRAVTDPDHQLDVLA
jgi:hypothetical protein